MHHLVCSTSEQVGRDILPVRSVAAPRPRSVELNLNFSHSGSVGRRIFWRHLFPPREEVPRQLGLGRPISCPQTRGLLIEIIFTLVKDDPTQFMWLLEDLNDLVLVGSEQEG